MEAYILKRREIMRMIKELDRAVDDCYYNPADKALEALEAVKVLLIKAVDEQQSHDCYEYENDYMRTLYRG
jgi:hypothetical protein